MTSTGENQVQPEDLQRSADDPDGTESLTPRQVEVLTRLLRVAYPHPDFPDGPYQRTAKLIQDADGSEVLPAGLDALAARADGDFLALDDERATALTAEVADGEFFRFVHATTMVTLYDDHEVWELLGYEGASFDQGGYLNRGFDDLDWLPKPRIEELDEPRVEIVGGAR